MRQRVVIAMALANDPDLLIADEATTALDATVQAQILELLNALCAEQGAALVFISHDLGVVARLCDRALVMYAGRVVEEASLGTLVSRPAHPYTRALLACSPELGRPDKPLPAIAGQPPSLNALPSGCHFAARCAYARAECLDHAPVLRPFGDGVRVRCIRAEELAAWNS
jgi:oligopeptide/dipeptide ABC transporter ATP-binding protein